MKRKKATPVWKVGERVKIGFLDDFLVTGAEKTTDGHTRFLLVRKGKRYAFVAYSGLEKI